MYKPVCSRLRLAVFCCIPRRNCKWNGAGWNNFRRENSKMKSGRMWPTAFETEVNLSGQAMSLQPRRLIFPVAADELLDAAKRFVVSHLHRWMLGKIGGRRMQYTADAAVKR